MFTAFRPGNGDAFAPPGPRSLRWCRGPGARRVENVSTRGRPTRHQRQPRAPEAGAHTRWPLATFARARNIYPGAEPPDPHAPAPGRRPVSAVTGDRLVGVLAGLWPPSLGPATFIRGPSPRTPTPRYRVGVPFPPSPVTAWSACSLAFGHLRSGPQHLPGAEPPDP